MCIPLYSNAKPILSAEPEINEDKPDPGPISGRIDFNGVTFRYQPDGPPILQNVSFSINPGEFVALVGPSGSGKSTTLRLLLGFEQPEAGSIYVDGMDISDVNIRSIRRQMGTVIQNGKILSGDIGKNIIGASSSLTLDDAWEAARAAGFDQDIQTMPMGMHTVISEGGGALSGGQRQRLLIARALAGKPRVVLMDEATSALDNRTQQIVTDSLAKMNVTRMVIAHRLSTIAKADRIIVLQSGSIVEQGTYDELMSLDGVFAAMARRQIA
jgi:ATP-binding cassette subfamily C protein